MNPRLQQVLQDIDQLSLEEQFEVLNHTTDQLKRQAVIPDKPKRKWLDIAGTASYPLMGEDAQDWVTRTRRDSQEHRDRLLGRDCEG